jgi:hypothetical protein
MKLLIAYKNGTSDEFAEVHIDCSERTIKGHASALIREWGEEKKGIYKIDYYTAVVLDEIISVRVMP